MNCKFSVAMSVYKNDVPEYFDRALSSITDKQTVKPDEIILVVDGPVSEGIDIIIDRYTQEYQIFKVIRLPENKGLGNALCVALAETSNDIVARMDSDDISLPDRFEQQLSYFELHPEIDVIGGDITEFIEAENKTEAKRAVPCTDAEIKEYLKTRCPMNHVSVMYRKTAVMKAGGYKDLFWNEDYYLWIRMYLSGAVFANTGTVLVNVRTGEDMYARRGGIKYYKSERFLQKLMLKNKMIGIWTYIMNCSKRFIVQVLMPRGIRKWVFKHFARKKIES